MMIIRVSFVIRKQLIQFFRAMEGFLASFSSLVHFINDKACQKGVNGDGINRDEKGSHSITNDEDNLSKTISTRRR